MQFMTSMEGRSQVVGCSVLPLARLLSFAIPGLSFCGNKLKLHSLSRYVSSMILERYRKCSWNTRKFHRNTKALCFIDCSKSDRGTLGHMSTERRMFLLIRSRIVWFIEIISSFVSGFAIYDAICWNGSKDFKAILVFSAWIYYV